MPQRRRHRMLFGADTDELGGTCFRLWAPAACMVEFIIGSQPARAPQLMPRLAGGWFELQLVDVGAGARHRFALDGGPQMPDQASRVQPDDVHGASEVVDPTAFGCLNEACYGRPWAEVALYELYAGAFTADGNLAGGKLDDRGEFGVIDIELMPVALESSRPKYLVIGGDLGTLAEGFQECMRAALSCLDDALGEENQLNMSGTVAEHFNCRRKMPIDLDKLERDLRIMALAGAIRDERRAGRRDRRGPQADGG